MYKQMFLEIALPNNEHIDSLISVAEILGDLAVKYGVEYLLELEDNIIPFIFALLRETAKNEKLINPADIRVRWTTELEFDYSDDNAVCLNMNEKDYSFGKVISR